MKKLFLTTIFALGFIGVFLSTQTKPACAEATRVYGKVYMTIDGEEILLPGVVLYREDNPGRPGNAVVPPVCVRDNGPVGTYAVSETEWKPNSSRNYYFRNSFERYNDYGPSLNLSNDLYFDCDKRKDNTAGEKFSSLGINPGGNPASHSVKNDAFCPEDDPQKTASCFKFGSDDAPNGYYAGGLSCGDGSPQYMLPYFPKRTVLGKSQICVQGGGCTDAPKGSVQVTQIKTKDYFTQNHPYIDFDENDPKGGGRWDANCISQSNPTKLKCSNNSFNWNFTSNRFPDTRYDKGETIYTLNNDNVGSMIIDFEWIPKQVEEPTCPNGVVDTGEECDDGNNVDSDACSNQCTLNPVCGDGTVDTGEECDGNTCSNGLACLPSCECPVVTASCGDGIINGTEECDGGTCANSEACTAACTCPATDTPSIGKTGNDVCSATNTESTVTYTVTVTNPTASPITATVTDVLDPDLDPTFVDADSISNGGTLTGNTITWTNLAVAADTTLTLTYEVVFPDEEFGIQFTNTVTLTVGGEDVDDASFNMTPDCETGEIPETGIEDSPVFSILIIGLGFAMFMLVGSEIMYGNVSNMIGKKVNLLGLLYNVSPKKDKKLYEEAVQYKKPETKDLYKKKKSKSKE